MLQTLGRRLYGKPDDHSNAQRLPFGLYLKHTRELSESQNEFNALKLVRQHTSIPAPAPLDFVSVPNDLDGSSDAYILMSTLPGEPLSRCRDVIGDVDFEQMKFQMRDYLAQIRDIPQTVNPAMPICNTLGEAIRDTRVLGGEPAGSFPDEASFSQVLRFSDDPARRGHNVVFCHADLNPRNILVHQHRRSDGSFGWWVSGIVDWEMAGYYPEYWDNTKALFEGFRWPLRYNDWVGEWFAEFGGYSREVDVERRSWEMGDGV